MHDWRQGVVELVRVEGADKRMTAKFLAFGVNGIAVAVMVVMLAREDATASSSGSSAALGRRLLDGRRVFTTMDGAKNLSPRPSVHGFKPWQELEVTIAGKQFKIIATPTKHVDNQECTGFLITSSDFGTGRDGLSNAIYFSGDTVYIPDLASIASRYHVTAAILNLGNAHVSKDLNDPDSPRYQITMDGKSAARLFREIKADVLVPMHYEAWGHFTQFGEELRQVFEEEGIAEKVCWLVGGKAVKVL